MRFLSVFLSFYVLGAAIAAVVDPASCAGDVVSETCIAPNDVEVVHEEAKLLSSEANSDDALLEALPACSAFKGDTYAGIRDAVKRWRTDSPDPDKAHPNDGIVFKNLGGLLPVFAPTSGNFYTEWGFDYGRPGSIDKSRVVINNKGNGLYVTFDHYVSFCKSLMDANDKKWNI